MNNNEKTIIAKLHLPDNFKFPISINDTMFTLVRNIGFNNKTINDVVSKMAIIKELRYVDLNDLSLILSHMKIKELNIFSIGNSSSIDNIVNCYRVDKGSMVNYLEFTPEQFIAYINSEDNKFLNYNGNSMYIIRSGSFIDMKNLFKVINGNHVNIGRWRGSESSHFKPFRFKIKLLSLGNV